MRYTEQNTHDFEKSRFHYIYVPENKSPVFLTVVVMKTPLQGPPMLEALFNAVREREDMGAAPSRFRLEQFARACYCPRVRSLCNVV